MMLSKHIKEGLKMKKELKQLILGMTIFSALFNANAWEKVDERKDNTPVRIIKKETYIKADEVDGTSIAPFSFNAKGSISGEGNFTDKNALYGSGGIKYTNMLIKETLSISGKVGNLPIKPTQILSHRYADLYLDLDGNPETAEGIAILCMDCPDVSLDLFNMKEGSQTTIGEIRNLGKNHRGCKLFHDVAIFCRSGR